MRKHYILAAILVIAIVGSLVWILNGGNSNSDTPEPAPQRQEEEVSGPSNHPNRPTEIEAITPQPSEPLPPVVDNSDASTDADGWITSSKWPYGKWKGGIGKDKPEGTDVTVIYTTETKIGDKFPANKISSQRGDMAVGNFKDGFFRSGVINYRNGKVEKIEQ